MIHAGDRLHEMDCCLLWISVQLTDFCVTFLRPQCKMIVQAFDFVIFKKKICPPTKLLTPFCNHGTFDSWRALCNQQNHPSFSTFFSFNNLCRSPQPSGRWCLRDAGQHPLPCSAIHWHPVRPGGGLPAIPPDENVVISEFAGHGRRRAGSVTTRAVTFQVLLRLSSFSLHKLETLTAGGPGLTDSG